MMEFTFTAGEIAQILSILVVGITFIVRTGARVRSIDEKLDAHLEDEKMWRDENALAHKNLRKDAESRHREVLQVIQKACNGDKVIVGGD